MIIVDVEVPALDMIYDFEMDEETITEEVMQKMVVLILQCNHLQKTEKEESCLYGLRQKKILNPCMTLKEQGIQNGDRLVLL